MTRLHPAFRNKEDLRIKNDTSRDLGDKLISGSANSSATSANTFSIASANSSASSANSYNVASGNNIGLGYGDSETYLHHDRLNPLLATNSHNSLDYRDSSNSTNYLDSHDNLVNQPDHEDGVWQPVQPWLFASSDECYHYHQPDMFFYQPGSYCNATFDNILCWPSTPLGHIASLPCPPYDGVDTEKSAYRWCSLSGSWMDKDGLSSDVGWTNYTECFIPDVRDLLNQLYSGSEEEAQMKFLVAKSSRSVEMVGLALSFVSLLLSLFIFSHFKFVDFRGPLSLPYFRKLRNNRTRIHKNLFAAILLQVALRLVHYTDQAIMRGDSIGVSASLTPDRYGIDSTPILCEGFFIALEYGRSAMFMWMFIEGMYLNNLISVAFFQGPPNYKSYYIIGWGLPGVMTVVWALAMVMWSSGDCWWGYSFTYFYWILEGPRVIVIGVNLMFLVNIMRILIGKLREANSCEAQQIRPLRRSVRNAFCLLPLLVCTNAITMIPKPLERSALTFGLWSYSTNILTSFQGFAVCCFYCFANADVKRTLRYFWRVKVTMRKRKKRQDNPRTLADMQTIYGLTPVRNKIVFKSRSKPGFEIDRGTASLDGTHINVPAKVLMRYSGPHSS